LQRTKRELEGQVIKALMIDVDGVLVGGRPTDGRHWATSLEVDLGLRFGLLQDTFFERHWEEIVTGRAELRERLAGILAQIAPGVTAERLVTYWFKQDARLNCELLEDLAPLRRGGLQVHLATNQEHERARYLMTTLGLAAHVDGCHYSAALGHRKPRPRFFDAVASKVGLPPGELLLIDDAEENVRAAIEAGWCAAQWTGRERLGDLVARHSPMAPKR
jgi:putative hydrolase of the HAD superfamily